MSHELLLSQHCPVCQRFCFLRVGSLAAYHDEAHRVRWVRTPRCCSQRCHDELMGEEVEVEAVRPSAWSRLVSLFRGAA